MLLNPGAGREGDGRIGDWRTQRVHEELTWQIQTKK